VTEKKSRFLFELFQSVFSAGVYKRQSEKISFFSKTWIFLKTRNGHFLSLGVFCIKRFIKFDKKIPYNVVNKILKKKANQNTPKSWSTFHDFSTKKCK
jgi:hypothetical protein